MSSATSGYWEGVLVAVPEPCKVNWMENLKGKRQGVDSVNWSPALGLDIHEGASKNQVWVEWQHTKPIEGVVYVIDRTGK